MQHGIQKWSKGASENDLYRPRRPENSAYYQCGEDHFEDFEHVYEGCFERAYGFYRAYLRSVIYTYLDCSILGKINILDMPLTFFVILATWAGYRYFAGECQRKGWLYLFYVVSALAFLTKGLIGVVFPFAITILWLSTSKRWGDILRLFSPVGM